MSVRGEIRGMSLNRRRQLSTASLARAANAALADVCQFSGLRLRHWRGTGKFADFEKLPRAMLATRAATIAR
jgi:hypothetical protein